MRRPSIKSPCVADRYHAHGERIAEVWSAHAQAGCLISLLDRWDDNGKPYLDVSIYRGDGPAKGDVHARVRLQREGGKE